MGVIDGYLRCSLFFAASALRKTISKMAEEEFRRLGLCPFHAFTLVLIVDTPGLSQKELASELLLAQSTVSRSVDALVDRGFLEKQSEGKTARIFPTDEGRVMDGKIRDVARNINDRCCSVLGEEEVEDLTRRNYEAYRKLREKD